MSDIFISYARADRDRIERLAAALEAEGFDVWWDTRLAGGSEFSSEIESRLAAARAVIVAWSAASVSSHWVADEAGVGRDRGVLAPIALDDTLPKIGFRQFHTIGFQKWTGDPAAPEFRALTETLRAKLGAEAAPKRAATVAAPASAAAAPAWRLLFAAGAAAIILSVFAVWIGVRSGGEHAPAAGAIAISDFEVLAENDAARRVARATPQAIEQVFSTNAVRTIDATTANATPSDDVGAEFSLRASVDSVGDAIAVTADIVDAASRQTLWSARIERPADATARMPEGVAFQLAEVIRCALYNRSRMKKAASVDLTALLLRMCEAEFSRGAQYDQMPELARRLVELAPREAQAHALRANALALLALSGPPDTEQLTAMVRDSAQKALALDPGNGAVRWALGVITDPAVTTADRVRELRQGLADDPDLVWTRNSLGHLMARVGRIAEARALYEKFVNDYPLDQQQRIRVAYYQAMAGNLRGAREQLDYIETYRPGWRNASIYGIRVEILFGEPERARAWIDRIDTSPADRACLDLVITARSANRAVGVEDLRAACGEFRIIFREQLYAMFGHVDAAYETLEENWLGYMEDPRTGPFFLFEPDFAAVRADPRFMEYMARLGNIDYWRQTGEWPDFCDAPDYPHDCRAAADKAQPPA